MIFYLFVPLLRNTSMSPQDIHGIVSKRHVSHDQSHLQVFD